MLVLKKSFIINWKQKNNRNSPRDDFWGIGKNGNGKNMLGILLMEIRFESIQI